MPAEICWKCKELKLVVTLCADDRLCPDCDTENERKLIEILAQQPAAKSDSIVKRSKRVGKDVAGLAVNTDTHSCYTD